MATALHDTFHQAKPWRFRFSLRAMFVLTTCAAAVLAIWIAPAFREQRLARELQRTGAEVTREASGPIWSRQIFGQDLRAIVGVSFRPDLGTSPAWKLWTKRPLTADHLSTLAAARYLRRLDLSFCTLDDDGLNRLSCLTQIEQLDLAYTCVSDAGATTLAEFSRLRWLRLHGNAITDAALDALAPMPQLEGLVLHDTQVSPGGLERLRRFAPQIQIHCLQVELHEIGLVEDRFSKGQWWNEVKFTLANNGDVKYPEGHGGYVLLVRRPDGSDYLASNERNHQEWHWDDVLNPGRFHEDAQFWAPNGLHLIAVGRRTWGDAVCPFDDDPRFNAFCHVPDSFDQTKVRPSSIDGE